MARTLEIKKSGESQKFNKLLPLGALTPHELQARSSTTTAFELIRQINTMNLQNLHAKWFSDKAKNIQAAYQRQQERKRKEENEQAVTNREALAEGIDHYFSS